jgi:transcriptional regulator GlxA family with amidase domain
VAVPDSGETVRIWRAPDESRVLLMAGWTRSYAVEPRGEYVLASAAGIGKFRLIRLFREQTGLPPYAFQIAHRIRRARRLLEAGQPIASVAASTGFADQSHLHRHFQRSLGITPLTYQRGA